MKEKDWRWAKRNDWEALICPLHVAGTVIRNKETEFARDLLRLSQQPHFILRDFETVIDNIRGYVAEVSALRALAVW